MSLNNNHDIQPAETTFVLKQLFRELTKIHKEIEELEQKWGKDKDNVWTHIDAIEDSNERILFGSSTSGLLDQNSGIVHRVKKLEEKLAEFKEEEREKTERQLVWKTTAVTLFITAIVSFSVAVFEIRSETESQIIKSKIEHGR